MYISSIDFLRRTLSTFSKSSLLVKSLSVFDRTFDEPLQKSKEASIALPQSIPLQAKLCVPVLTLQLESVQHACIIELSATQVTPDDSHASSLDESQPVSPKNITNRKTKPNTILFFITSTPSQLIYYIYLGNISHLFTQTNIRFQFAIYIILPVH